MSESFLVAATLLGVVIGALAKPIGDLVSELIVGRRLAKARRRDFRLEAAMSAQESMQAAVEAALAGTSGTPSRLGDVDLHTLKMEGFAARAGDTELRERVRGLKQALRAFRRGLDVDYDARRAQMEEAFTSANARVAEVIDQLFSE